MPLSELVAKPLPPRDASKKRDTHENEAEAEEEEDRQELPQLKRVEENEAIATPKRQIALRDEEKLTSSALRGGAASGLLSLARGALGED